MTGSPALRMPNIWTQAQPAGFGWASVNYWSGVSMPIAKLKPVRLGKHVALRILHDAWGRPQLLDGVYEIYRRKLEGPLGQHFGVLVVTFGIIRAYDLRQGEEPRNVSLDAFADGLPVYIVHRVPPGVAMDQAMARLQVAWGKYSDWELWTNNCEHFARFVVRGERVSGQVQAMTAVGLLGLVALLVGRG